MVCSYSVLQGGGPFSSCCSSMYETCPRKRGRGAGEDPHDTKDVPSRNRQSPLSSLLLSANSGYFLYPSLSFSRAFHSCIAVLYIFFAVVQTRHFLVMLKLLLVFCNGCSTISFLLPRMSLIKRQGEGEAETFRCFSRAVVANSLALHTKGEDLSIFRHWNNIRTH